MTVKTTLFDPADYLDSEVARAEYLTASLETGDAAFVAESLGVIARAKGMTTVARDARLSRESLYKGLSANGNPELQTVLRVCQALGLALVAVPMEEGQMPASEDSPSVDVRQGEPQPRALR
jgi:probable addiction module antidote protein